MRSHRSDRPGWQATGHVSRHQLLATMITTEVRKAPAGEG